jgi:uncharacterized membrane protein SpoIIM required for sporulation
LIVDLERFVKAEKPYWEELEKLLDLLEKRTGYKLSLNEAKRFHYLYQRASSDLSKLAAFPSEPRLNQYLETLVGKAYAEIHESREKAHRFSPVNWFFNTFPQTFRKHSRAFALSVAITFVGCMLGGFIIYFDKESKSIIFPFEHLLGDPSKRVEREEAQTQDRMSGAKASFSAQLMTHNTKVSILTFSMGMTFGLGTILLLFYNGVILGAVSIDYILAGEAKFLAGWLLPHGVIEIPAILIAGQAGFVLGKTLIGRGDSNNVRQRLRSVQNDLVTLIFGVAVLLIWAGIIESFLSQYHEPVIPYWLKIMFGVFEFSILTLFLWKSGRKAADA